MAGKFEFSMDKADTFRRRLKAGNAETVATSKGYNSRASAKNGVKSVQGNAPGAAVVDQAWPREKWRRRARTSSMRWSQPSFIAAMRPFQHRWWSVTPAIRVGVGLIVLAAIGSSCSGDDRDSVPPLGLGVDDEQHLTDVLSTYGMSYSKAECVAGVAFDANPSTKMYADGSYDITRAMLTEGGQECGVDWSDYDFTGD